MEPEESGAPLLTPKYLLWLGLALFAVLALALLGRPAHELVWGYLVFAGAVVWFACADRGMLPLWPLVLLAPAVIVLPEVLFGWGEDPLTAGDLASIGGLLVVVAAMVAGVEVLIRRDVERERAVDAGVLGETEAREEDQRDLRLALVLGVGVALTVPVLVVIAVRDGGWLPFLVFGAAPIVLPDLWRRLRRAKPDLA